MRILVIDVGGTNVKVLATGQKEPRRHPSGSKLTPRRMVEEVRALTKDWSYDVIAIGYPGLVLKGRIAREPHNLAKGWVGFDFEQAFRKPVRVVNDAAMQALGHYRKGIMLFLGLGTGLGSAVIADGVLVPMELAHLGYRKATYEDYVGLRGKKRFGRKKWSKHVAIGVARIAAALNPDDIVLGGGNAKKLKKLPPGCRAGANANAFLGGFRLWEGVPTEKASVKSGRAGGRARRTAQSRAARRSRA